MRKMKRCGFAARARGTFTTEYKVEAAHRLIDSGRTIAEVARELSLLQHSQAPIARSKCPAPSPTNNHWTCPARPHNLYPLFGRNSQCDE